ncbi:MAG: sensor histidine kinase [Phycisphaerae bacterium]
MLKTKGRNKRKGYNKQLGVGLALKAVLILAFVVVTVTVTGGYFYFCTARQSLRNADRLHAERMGQAIGLAAQHDLHRNKFIPLQRLATDLLRNDRVHYVALLDEDGTVVATASQGPHAERWAELISLPVSVSGASQVNDDVLTLSRPIIAPSQDGRAPEIVGAVRLALDTSSTTTRLVAVQQRMGVIAAAIVLCGIPLGYLLVWRVMVQPVKKLASLMHDLAGGDFSARLRMKRNDEIGQLAKGFNTMAFEVDRMRKHLMLSADRLEQKVQDRTTELEMTNRRLRDAIREKDDFLRAVSHDLNAPLRNIAGMATMIMMKWQSELPEEVVARLQRIQTNVDMETSMISELLELSRIKTRPQKRESVDMGRLISVLKGTFEYELKERDIEVDIVGNMPSIYVEKNRIRQAFQNLIDNAIKYMHRSRGGRIEVGYKFVDGYHRFCVADTGPGIPHEQLDRIFTVFRRGDNPLVGKVDGKGVGLALVKTVVANYDGRAWAESEVGKGSKFYIALSDHCVQANESPRSDNRKAVSAGSEK